jgi:two-component system OmpR family response regulator
MDRATDEELPKGNIIDMHVHRLRQKIEHGFDRKLIHTVLGAGYRIGEPIGGGNFRQA